MSDSVHPVHPLSLWGTGAPFVLEGKHQRHLLSSDPPEGFRVIRDVEAVSPGGVVCCHRWSTEPRLLTEVNMAKFTYMVTQCVEKDWGEHNGHHYVTYDLVLSESDELRCPSCLAREVMGS